MAEKSPAEVFESLKKELERAQRLEMVSYIDSVLHQMAQHVTAHPDVLPEGTMLKAFLDSLDAQVRFIWGADVGLPLGTEIITEYQKP